MTTEEKITMYLESYITDILSELQDDAEIKYYRNDIDLNDAHKIDEHIEGLTSVLLSVIKYQEAKQKVWNSDIADIRG